MISDDFLGEGYGMTTPAALSAIEEFASTDGIALDPVYTGKTGAAFLTGARNGISDGKPLLFWHTKSSQPLPSGGNDYHRLPADFHRYFTTTSAVSRGQ